MKGIVLLFFFYYPYILLHVKCQQERLSPKPQRCYGTPELLDRQCCVFPPFFKRDVAKICGGKFSVMYINKDANVTGLRREASDPCEYWQCVLNKYLLLNPDGNLDDDKYFTHLDKWITLNPEFTNVMRNAKISCKQQYRMLMPLSPCAFYHLQSCIRHYINVHCPVMIPSAECQELKLFYDKCRDYFLKK